MEYWIQKSPDSPASGPYSLDQVQKLIRQKKWRPDWKASPDGRSFLSFSSVFANPIAKFEQEEAEREKLESEEQNRKQLELDRKEQLRKEAQRTAAILEAEKTRPVAPRSASNDKANANTSRAATHLASTLDRLILRVTYFSGWVLMLIGLFILGVTFLTLFNMLVLTPLQNVADAASSAAKKEAALEKLGEKMRLLDTLSPDDRRAIAFNSSHPLHFYVLYRDAWDAEIQAKKNSKPTESRPPVAMQAPADSGQDLQLFRDAGLAPDPTFELRNSDPPFVLASLVSGSIVNMLLLATAGPVLLIGFGAALSGWSSLQLRQSHG